MKFKIGRLNVEVLLSLEEEINTPPEIIAPSPVINPPKPVDVDVVLEPIATVQPITNSTGISNKVRDLIYTITSAFEGGTLGKINFSNLSGNFDGQGLSIGFLQWCVGQGSDVPLHREMLKRYPEQMKAALGSFYKEFVDNLELPIAKRLAWAIRSINHNNQIDQNWKKPLLAYCATPGFQEIQKQAADKVLLSAKKICTEYGLKSVRGLMLAFDICTQNGSISSSTKKVILEAKAAKEKVLKRSLKEREFLEIIAIKRAEASNPKWIADVKSRKLCIVNGTGIVHGDKYNLNALGLSDDPF